MLDRVHARLERGAQPGAPERVAHHAAPERVRFRHQRLHLAEGEGRVERPVPRARAGPAGGRGLDHVGAGADHGADHVAHRVRPVGHALRQQGIVGGAAVVARRAHAIADAAGRRDDLHRQHQARPRDQPLLDGELEAGVEPAAVAHGRVAHGERLREHARGAEMRGARGLVEAPARGQAVAVRGQVVVRVDQAGDHGPPARVDDLGVRGPGERGAGPGGGDAARRP